MAESRARLIALVRNFDRDANGSRKAIRELLESDPEAFYCGAVAILKGHDDSRASQFLIAMLVAYDLLWRALCDPAFTQAQAMELARSAASVDPMTDVALAKRLADSATSDDAGIRPDDASRVMEILSEISDGSRIQSSLMRLLRHSNPYVRSKAVKLVGRGSGSVKWVRSRLTESDPRIRANAVEALWGTDSEEARELLITATRDGNNRVAGNALLALYLLGDTSVIPELLKMTDHGSALFRSSAAWVMGETGDPRFAESLARMLREPNAALRGRAMTSLGKIKAAMARLRLGPEWLATGMMLECDPQKLFRKLQLAITSEDGGEHHKVLPTQFLLTEDGKQVLNYKVTERQAPDAMSVIFVFPRNGVPGSSAWTRGALSCRGWKRTSDMWAVQTYIASQFAEGEAVSSAEDALPHYSANPETITAALSTPPPRTGCVDLWKSVWNIVRADQQPPRGRRHIILFSDEPPDRTPGDGLLRAVSASRTLVQVISTVPDATLERFSRRVGGGFKVADSEEAVAREISMAYLNLLARYEICYAPPGAGAVELKVRISSPGGWAAISLALPSGG